MYTPERFLLAELALPLATLHFDTLSFQFQIASNNEFVKEKMWSWVLLKRFPGGENVVKLKLAMTSSSFG